MRLFATLLLFALALPFAAPAAAQSPGDCTLGEARTDLAFGDVRARLFNKGNLFYSGGSPLYEVPKGGGISPVFAAGIWVGGLVGGDLRTAAATYAQGEEDYEYWPGPLAEDGTPPEDCAAYDRFWVVNVREIEHYEATGEASPDLLDWPVNLGAPVLDGDGVEGNYDLDAGDRPLLYGHEAAFWVMNDAGGPHRTTLTDPIGLEVRATASTVAGTDPAFRQATLYRYELVYRGEGAGSAALEDAYFTLWVDPDLGNFSDDYVGTDTTRGLAYVYNADNDDQASAGGYGLNPPAVGYDFLSGAGHTMWFFGSPDPDTGGPDTAEDYYNYMQARWLDGMPLTEGGYGDDPEGMPIDFLFPGDPVVPTFWTERCPTPACAAANPPNDRRHIISTPAFALQPGETQTVDFAILYARGDDHLDSITDLRAVSDAVQTRYDAGSLFAPFKSPPSLPAPVLLSPADGAEIYDAPVTFSWEPVPGADSYIVEALSSGGGRIVLISEESTLTVSLDTPENQLTEVQWRVRAENENAVGLYSAYRTLVYYRFQAGILGNGTGIVEIANPDASPCPDPGDPGCESFGGNTVWLDPNVTDDYVLTTPDNRLDLFVDLDILGSDDFELRFTEACATPGSCLGAYIRDGEQVVSVPFELWNIGDGSSADDDVRMIPLIRDHSAPLANWADSFTATQEIPLGDEVLELGVTERVFWMMPDRPNGYELFAAAAAGFGGAGAIYLPDEDGDAQVDTNANGGDCARQGWYIDFCYRSVPPFQAPIGGSDGMLLADLAGDGTTPPAGTVVRFQTENQVVDSEDGPGQPTAFALTAAYPNPFAASATVEYTVGRATDLRLSVYDVLGRRVAVLAEGAHAAGTHRARLDGPALASGVYLVVLEADGGAAHTQTLARALTGAQPRPARSIIRTPGYSLALCSLGSFYVIPRWPLSACWAVLWPTRNPPPSPSTRPRWIRP